MTVIEELKAKTDEAAAIAAKLATAEKVNADSAVLLQQAQAQAEACIKSEQAAVAKLAEVEKAHVEAMKAKDEQLAKVSADLAAAQKALANPSFAAAAVQGSKEAVGGGALSSEQKPFATKEEAMKAYCAIPDSDPKSRAEFRIQNKDILGLK